MKRIRYATVACACLAAAGAVASVTLTERSTKTKGATTIRWDSAFQDLDYTVGDTLTFTVHWDVLSGTAQYAGFVLKRVTPRSKRDPAVGTLGAVTHSGNSATVNFTFSELHLDKRRNVEVGTAHLKLYLMIDTDGDGVVDSRAGYGVNLHVEDPQ